MPTLSFPVPSKTMTTQQELVPVAGAKAFPLLWVLGISWDFLGSPEFEFHLFLGDGSRKHSEPGQGAKKPGGSSVALGPDRSPRSGQGQPRAAKSGQDEAKKDQETAKVEVRAVVDSDLPRRDEEIGGLSPRRAFESMMTTARRQRLCGKADATPF